MERNVGKVVQVVGPVIDVKFESGRMPNILNAITIPIGDRKIVAEVLLHLGDGVITSYSIHYTKLYEVAGRPRWR